MDDRSPKPLGPEGSRSGDIEVTPIEARSAVKVGPMRWVLGISTALAIIGLFVVWMTLR